jgi:DNA replication protein DnaC
MPVMASQFSTLAEQAVREKKTHTGYLEVLLTAEIEEREQNTIERRIKEAHLPRVKTLEEFDCASPMSKPRQCLATCAVEPLSSSPPSVNRKW